MMAGSTGNRWVLLAVWVSLGTYAGARLCQFFAGRVPSLLLVVLHVVPAAVFALAHGTLLYRAKGIAVFVAICVGVATLSESVSLRTGFPFGHYYFTDVMGPKVLGLPILLVLAYVGIGYCSWILSLLILGYRETPLTGVRVVLLPMLASMVLTAWDLAMDPAWGTIDKAWIWRDGGAFYGVPVSNFLGWYLTAYVFYQAFAVYCNRISLTSARSTRTMWSTPILFYAVCAFGNLLLLGLPMPAVVTDATGRQWATGEILAACALVSVLLMGPLSALAWTRLPKGVFRRV